MSILGLQEDYGIEILNKSDYYSPVIAVVGHDNLGL